MYFYQLYIMAVGKLSLSGEAIAAIDRSVFSGLERHLGACAAGSTGSGEHLSAGGSSVTILTGRTARFATGGFISETLLSKKILLAGSENKLFSTVSTGNVFVLVHVWGYLT